MGQTISRHVMLLGGYASEQESDTARLRASSSQERLVTGPLSITQENLRLLVPSRKPTSREGPFPDRFPPEIEMEICQRLDIKSLLRFGATSRANQKLAVQNMDKAIANAKTPQDIERLEKYALERLENLPKGKENSQQRKALRAQALPALKRVYEKFPENKANMDYTAAFDCIKISGWSSSQRAALVKTMIAGLRAADTRFQNVWFNVIQRQLPKMCSSDQVQCMVELIRISDNVHTKWQEGFALTIKAACLKSSQEECNIIIENIDKYWDSPMPTWGKEDFKFKIINSKIQRAG